MENQNYNDIGETLRNRGLSEDEIRTRLMKAKISTSGHYDPITDSYSDLSNYEPPVPSNIPPLENPSEEDFKRLKMEEDKKFLAPFELDPSVEDDPIQFCFEYEGIGFSPKGDIQALKGAQKNGKSFFLCLLMGASMKGEYLGVKCLIENPKILYCDTEQHPRNTRRIYRRVCQIAGIDGHIRHDRISMQHLRLADDVQTIKKAIRLKIEYYQPDICMIDGLVDCLVDFNDLKESKQVITELSKIALESNCCIWCVLHTNPSDESKMRGHAGTLLSQKSSDVIMCKKTHNKDDGTTIFEVEQTDNRNNAEIHKFSFAIECRKNDRGEFIAIPVKSYVSIQEKNSLDELFRWALKDSPLRKSDLANKLQSEDSPMKCKRATAYNHINNALDVGIISDDDVVTHRLRYVGLNLNNDEEVPF